MAIRPMSTLRDIILIYDDVKKTSAKVTELSKEVRDLENRLSGDIRGIDTRLVKVETRLEMIYDLAVGRAGRGGSGGSQEPPLLPDSRS